MSDEEKKPRRGISRRAFLTTLGAGGAIAGGGLWLGRDKPAPPLPPQNHAEALTQIMDRIPDADLSGHRDPVTAYRRAFSAFEMAIDAAMKELDREQAKLQKDPMALGGIDITFRPALAGGTSGCQARLRMGGEPVNLPALAHAFDAYAELHRQRRRIDSDRMEEESLRDVPSGAAFIEFLIARQLQRFPGAVAPMSREEREEQTRLLWWGHGIYNASCALGDIPCLAHAQHERENQQRLKRSLQQQPSAVFEDYFTVRLADHLPAYAPAFMASLAKKGNYRVPVTVTIENPRFHATAAGMAAPAR